MVYKCAATNCISDNFIKNLNISINLFLLKNKQIFRNQNEMNSQKKLSLSKHSFT